MHMYLDYTINLQCICRAGKEFYSLAVDLRGFYLKVQIGVICTYWRRAHHDMFLMAGVRVAAGTILCGPRRVCAGAHLQGALPAA